MKQKFILPFLFFFYLFVSGQENTTTQFPVLISPSPEAFSLGKYGQIPVGLFTGTIQNDLPLYNIELNGIKIPLSLNYSSNGIRVDEIPSIVGLGWSLAAGGVIIRSLNDEADEVEGNRVQLPNTGYGSSIMKDFLSQVLNNTGMDTQPDIFSFNFLGYSGKFYLDNSSPNPLPHLIEPSPLRIEMQDIGVYGANLFKITTPDGIVYWFGGNEATELTRTRSTGNISNGGPHYSVFVTNAWHLSKITLLNKDEIKFIYTVNNLAYDGGISQQIHISKTQHYDDIEGWNIPVYTPAIHEAPVILESYVKVGQLVEILWPNGKIKFGYSPMFSTNDNNFKKLNYLSVVDNNNKLIKKFKFEYLETMSDLSYLNPDMNQSIQSIAVNQKRVFLEKVIDSAGIENNPSYLFEYYFPDQLPPRLSYAQDYWGYFNGKHNPDLVPNDISFYNPTSVEDPSLTKEVITSMFQNIGGNRNADGQFGIKGLLKKIQYPTKGFTEFHYDSHSYIKNEFQYPDSITPINLRVETGASSHGTKYVSFTTGIIPFTQKRIPVTFLKVQRIIDCGDTSNITHLSEMFVSIRNVISNKLVPIEYYASAIGQYVKYTGSMQISYDDMFNYYMTFDKDSAYKIEISVTGECLLGRLEMQYYSQNGQYVDNSINVGGMRISKIINNAVGNETIKKYYYGNFDCLNCSSGQLEEVKPAISFHTTANDTYDHYGLVIIRNREVVTNVFLNSSSLNPLFNAQGYHIGYSNVIEGLGENFEGGAVYHKYNIVFDRSPLVFGDPILGTSYTNEFENGQELQNATFTNVQGALFKVQDATNNFISDAILDDQITGFTTSESSITNSQLLNAPYSTQVLNLNTYQIKSKWYHKSQTIYTKYDPDIQHPIAVLTKYFYDNPVHMQPTRILSSSSTGAVDDLLTKLYYPQDLIAQAPNAQMIDQNIVANPIRTEKYVNTNVTTTQVKYKDWGNGLLLPETVESFSGVTTPSPSQPQLRYYHYDIKGNPIELSKEYGPHISYIWGYSNAYPIAETKNASTSECDYTGFENHEAPNWQTYNTWSFIDDFKKVKTGNSAVKTTGYGPTKYFPVGNLAGTHSGYKASVWVKGGTDAYLQIQVNDDYSLSKRSTNPNIPVDSFNLIVVELPYTFYKNAVSPTMNIKVYCGSSGTAYFDDLRFYPMDAQMTTYTYDPLIGMTSMSDVNNKPTIYKYDGFNRLWYIKDFQRNILKKYDYHYKP